MYESCFVLTSPGALTSSFSLLMRLVLLGALSRLCPASACASVSSSFNLMVFSSCSFLSCSIILVHAAFVVHA